MKSVALILFALSAVLITGCATSQVRFGHEESAFYPAVYADCSLVDSAIEEQATLLLFAGSPILLVDFACSVVSDTVLLPYDLGRLAYWEFVERPKSIRIFSQETTKQGEPK